MSKLYNQYLKLKSDTKEKNIIYLFKSGIFYICLDEDARKMSDIFDFKITPLNEDVVKCGFPLKRLNYYTKLLEQMNITYEIIDNEIIQSNKQEYLQNAVVQNIIDDILKLDMNNISYKQAFELLHQMQLNLKNLEKNNEKNIF